MAAYKSSCGSKVKRRPLFWLSIAFGFGVWFSAVAALPPIYGFGAAIFFYILALGSVVYHQARDGLQVLVLFTVFACGAVHWSVRVTLPEDHVANLVRMNPRSFVRLRGVVSSRPRYPRSRHSETRDIFDRERSPRTRFNLSSLNVESGGQWTSVGGFVKTTADSLLSDLRYGHKVECVGWLFRPRGPSNPGEVDFRQVLERKGIHAGGVWSI